MHKLQKTLLGRLKLNNNQRYATLTSGYDFEDNVVFHLNQLISKDLIQKKAGVYSITKMGIQEVSQYETSALVDRGLKTFFVGFLCKDEGDNYLLKSHPQAKTNFYNLPSGKPYFGESTDTSLGRLFYESTGLRLTRKDFNFVSLHLKTIAMTDGEVLFDDAFGIYEIRINEDQRTKMKLATTIGWYSKEEIKKLKGKWPEIDMCIGQKDVIPYSEYTFTTNYIL